MQRFTNNDNDAYRIANYLFEKKQMIYLQDLHIIF
jgi:hypothetical protein